MSKCTKQWLTIYGKKLIFNTPGNPSLAHQEAASDVIYEPPAKKISSITAATIYMTDDRKFDKKNNNTRRGMQAESL